MTPPRVLLLLLPGLVRAQERALFAVDAGATVVVKSGGVLHVGNETKSASEMPLTSSAFTPPASPPPVPHMPTFTSTCGTTATVLSSSVSSCYNELAPAGHCCDWRYLPEGGYPARLTSSSPLYDPDPVIECINRCQNAYGTPQQAIYLDTRSNTCACSSGSCTSIAPNTIYQSYNNHCQPPVPPPAMPTPPTPPAAYAPRSPAGYCVDWRYLPEGGYPARLTSSSPLYDPDPVIECINRCQNAYGTPQQAIYLDTRSNTCACSSGSCASIVASTIYQAFEILTV